MIGRYTRPEMGRIWELENKFAIWKEIEVLACEAQAELGQAGITREEAQWIRDHADFTVEEIDEIEKVTNHDVIAFTTCMANYIDADIPEGGDKPSRWVHYGMTSSDLGDTALSYQVTQACDIIIEDIKRLGETCKRRAFEFQNTLCVGRTHGIHAEPMTFGMKFGSWAWALKRALTRMEEARAVAATGAKVVMIEAGADEIPDEIMYAGIVKAHEEIRKQIDFINQIVAEIGKPKMEYDHAQFNQELFDDIVANFMDEAKAAMDTDDKTVREQRWNEMIDHWHEKYLEQYPDMDQYLEEFTYKFQKKIVKAWLLEGHRVDGRAQNEIRPLAAEVGILPRVHGSGLFTRGQTQVLSICTLNTLSAAQKLDTIWEEEEKRYMHHYNFPAFSTGEARAARSITASSSSLG